MNRRSTFQDFVKEASEVLGDFMLPGGEAVWRNMTPQDAEAKKLLFLELAEDSFTLISGSEVTQMFFEMRAKESSASSKNNNF